jgi:pyruvate formate lyase activating enzyme
MKQGLKKKFSIILGLLFMTLLILVPTIIIQITVRGINLAVRIKNIPENITKQKLPANTVEPIEKAAFFHILPGASAYVPESINQNIACSDCPEKNNQALSPEATATEIIKKALSAKTSIIVLPCPDSEISSDYALKIASLAKAKDFLTALSYNGCLDEDILKKIISPFDAIKIIVGNIDSGSCQMASDSSLNIALKNIKTVKGNGKHLEVSFLLDEQNSDDDEINIFLNSLKESAGSKTIIHFSGTKRAEPIMMAEKIKRAKDLARQAGFNYVYGENQNSAEEENTYCQDGSIAFQRQNLFLIKNNTKDGVCADGTTIPGIFKK